MQCVIQLSGHPPSVSLALQGLLTNGSVRMASVGVVKAEERLDVEEPVGISGIHFEQLICLSDVALDAGCHSGHVGALCLALSAHQAMQQQPAQCVALRPCTTQASQSPLPLSSSAGSFIHVQGKGT